MQDIRIIVAGGRNFNNYKLLCEECISFINSHNYNSEQITIITGGAKGADYLGKLFADEFGYKPEVIEAPWEEYGLKAGRLRNAEMAQFALQGDIAHLIAFWDGKSKGTGNMISIAKAKKISGKVIQYEYE
jgi:hypothetical protein